MALFNIDTTDDLTTEEQDRLEDAARRVVPAHHEVTVNEVPVRSKPE